MKTQIFLLGAAITAFTFSTFASDALLSPRQKDNQARVVTSSVSTQGGAVAYVTSDAPVVLSPRGKDNQSMMVKGVANDSNPALTCAKNMNGTPKMISECASHTTMPGCATVASAK